MSKDTLSTNAISERVKPKNILVLGDVMLDVYTIGCVKRLSPEAPVPVLCVSHEEGRAGGAGNTALNLRALGMQVRLLSRVGKDLSGEQLLAQLKEEGVCTAGCLSDAHFLTPRKNRMMADNHQIVRVDYERPLPLSPTLEKQLIAQLPELLEGIDVIAISDYAKGFVTPTLLQAVRERAHVPILVDPKGRDFHRYRGATLIKPNLSEVYAAAGMDSDIPLPVVAQKILETVDVQMLIVTRAHEGISLFMRHQMPRDFPVEIHEVRDVTGAGDTVLAMLTAAWANEVDVSEAITWANRAAAIAISRTGCARVSLADLIK